MSSSKSAVRSIVEQLPDRDRTAGRLLTAAAKTSFDPLVELDWDAPLAEDRFYAPPHRSSLYGTYLWDQLTHEQRIELTKHEVASLASVGVFFETALMQMLVRYAYDRDPTSAHVQWTYTEIADECRHSVMLARMVSKFGAPAYGPGPIIHILGKIFKAISTGPLTFLGVLYVEEILDAFQREAMADETLQPLVRGVSRIHVIEEARHIRYAAEEGARQWQHQLENMGWLSRAFNRLLLGAVVYASTVCLIHPQAYAAVGLDPREARQVARNNPHWQQSLAWAARKPTTYINELGLIAGPGRFFWKRLGLIEELPIATGPVNFVRRRLRLAG